MILALVVMMLPLLSSYYQVVYADGDIVVAEDTESSYLPTTLVNGDFSEEPWMDYWYNGTLYTKETSPKSSLSNIKTIPNGTNMGWNTTDNATYYVSPMLSHGGSMFDWSATIGYHYNAPMYGNNGNHYIEMNLLHGATLYQDLTTYSGDVIMWTLKHAFRTDSGGTPQAMTVEIGSPEEDESGNIIYAEGTNSNIRTHIIAATKATYDSTGVTGYNGFAASGELTNLSLTKEPAGSTDYWKPAKGVYVIPEGQTITRFAFVSLGKTPDGGNELDDITFSTLIGNLSATADADGNVTVRGYWGDSDSSKKLCVKIGETVHQIDMSSVLNKNFVITIPYSIIDGATSVKVYHVNYEDAARTVNIEHIHTWNYSVGEGTDSNKLIATCTCAKGTHYCSYKDMELGAEGRRVPLTLSATSKTYSGSAYTGASLNSTEASAWTDAGLTLPAIKYVGRDTTTYTESETAPTNAGKYTAKITASDESAGTTNEATASVDFEITKSNQSAPLVSKLSDETIIGKNDGTMSGLTTAMEYRLSAASSYSSVTAADMGFAAGTYKVRYKGTTNYNASPDTEVVIAEGDKLTVTLPTVSQQTGYTITVDSASNNWHATPTLTFALKTGYSKTNTFKVKVNGDEITLSSNNTYTLPAMEADATVTVEGVADITAPSGEIKIDTNIWNTFLNTITFGTFFKETKNVTITASDLGSGVDAIKYYVSESALTLVQVKALEDTNWTTFENFSIDPNRNCVVYAKLTDNAGNTGYISSDGLVFDNVASVINGIESGKIYCENKLFTVTDENLDKVIAKEAKSGKEIVLTATEGKYKLPSYGIAYNVIATDKAGNSTTITNVTAMNGHDFRYSSTDNVLEASCTRKGTCGLADVSLTITAANATYTGSAYTGASLNSTEASAWTDAGLTLPAIKYVGRDTTTYTESKTAPTNAGKYTAKITASDGLDKTTNVATASVDFEITKLDQSAPLVSKLSDETIIGKNDGTMSGLTTAMEYRLSSDSSYSTVTAADMGFAAGTYKVRYKGTTNYNASPDTEVVIAEGDKLTVTLPTVSQQTGYTITVDSASNNWHATPTITFALKTGYSKTNTFKVKVNGDEITLSSNDTYTLPAMEADATVTVEGVADITAPSGEIKIDTNIWNTFLNNINFGNFFKETKNVTITGSDSGSGLDAIKYYVSESALTLDQVKALEDTNWTIFESFSIAPNRNCVIYAKLTDNAGNTAYLSSEGLVFDDIAPVIDGIESGKKYCSKVEFTVTDENLDKVIAKETANENADEIVLTAGENGKYSLPADGETSYGVTYKIIATDKAGNSTTITSVTAKNGHDFSGEWTIVKEATSTEGGRKETSCLNGCGTKKIEIIPAKGEKPEYKEPASEESITKPKTGDSNNIVFWVVMVAVGILIVFIVFLTGKRRKEEE